MNRILAIVAVLSLFVAGIAVGALGMRIYDDRQRPHFDDAPGPGDGFIGRHLHRMLDLSAGQIETIDSILQRSHDQAMELRNDLHPRVMEIMDRAHEEIAEVLSPEQRERFQQFLQDNRRRAERWFLGSPRGRGHGRHRPWVGPGHRPYGPPPAGPGDAPSSGWEDGSAFEDPDELPPHPSDDPGNG